MNLLSMPPAIHTYNSGVLEADIIHARIAFFPTSPLVLSNAVMTSLPLVIQDTPTFKAYL